MRLLASETTYVAEPEESRLTTFQSLAIASQFGVSLAAAVALGLVVGQWLDVRAGTGFVFTLIGVFSGLAAATMSTVTIYRAALRRRARGSSANPTLPPTAGEDDRPG